jgi:hypothetical protein
MRTTSTDTTAGWLGIWVKWTGKVTALSHGLQKFMRFFPTHNDSVNDSVEARTIVALNSKKVPCSTVIVFLTIIALNINHSAQLGWNGLKGDTGRHRIPGGHHAFFRLGRLFTNGAARVVSR